MPGAGKQPLHVGMKDGAPFALAGLTDRWLSPEGEVLDTCAIVTTQANALLAPLHERMPVIIAPEDYERWLDVAEEEVADLFEPYPAEAMAYFPVSTSGERGAQRRRVVARARRGSGRGGRLGTCPRAAG